MMRAPVKLAAALALPLVLGGCVSASEYAAKNAGFSSVEAKTAEAVGKQTVWIQNQQHARVVSDRVKSLMAKKAIDVETAVQVALLNNKGLQAAYADLGDSAAAAWQSTMLVNPTVSVGLTGLGTPRIEAFKSVEGMIANNILELATRDRNIAIADTGFRRAQLNAALRTLQLASDTRRAWINAVAAWETVAQLNQAQAAADAASELAQELGKSGALTKEGQAREHVFYAELAGQTAKARLEARLAKEELTRLMGLWGSGIDYQVPNRLPQLPKGILKRDLIEAEALQRRVDLQMAKLDLEATAKSYRLTEATRYVTDLELLTVLRRNGGKRKTERSRPEDDRTGRKLEFVIPIFDSGKARMRKASSAYMRAANFSPRRPSMSARKHARPIRPTRQLRYPPALPQQASCRCAPRSRRNPSSLTTR